MGRLEELVGKTVAMDSAPLIYFIEQRAPYVDWLRPLFQMVEAGQVSLCTSVVTLVEVLVHPIRSGDEALGKEYQDILLHGRNVTTVPVTATIAQTAAELRAERGLKAPDAIHLATAVSQHAAVFLTNDRDFGRGAPLPILRVSELGG
ncbi:MAG: type II toxin-antitoxin system VapC family toxin [Lacipirellulaceae bacterium]